MRTTLSSTKTKFKVGLFSLAGLITFAAFTFYVNERPKWWRSCQSVRINVEDATGLKNKSPIRSLGIEIGYLQSIGLSETHVTLGICITAPIEVLPSTRAYIRAEGFLGDKFVELKPVKYMGPGEDINRGPSYDDSAGKDHSRLNERKPKFKEIPTEIPEDVSKSESFKLPDIQAFLKGFWREMVWMPSAWAEQGNGSNQAPTPKSQQHGGREIPVQGQGQDIEHVVNQVDELVREMTGLTNNLKEAINPEELKKTMRQLNTTLENASRTLAPEGGLTQTAQRTLAKLEDAIEQLRDQAVRINKGQGSLGMLLNDPVYAEELHLAIQNINAMLNRVSKVKFVSDIGAAEIPSYNGARGWFNIAIWPNEERYFLLGLTVDPRGQITSQIIKTTVGGTTQTLDVQTTNPTGVMFTAMLGKVYYRRIDLSIGALYGDGTASAQFFLGPSGNESKFAIRNDFYFRTAQSGADDRISLIYNPFMGLYLRAGLESMRPSAQTGRTSYFIGAGISFTDDDIKLLFALK